MTDPGQFPAPDVLDSAGRFKRLVVSLAIGITAGIVAYLIADSLASPDQLAAAGGQMERGYQFVYYVTGLAGAVCFGASLAIQNRLAARRWRTELVPRARDVSRE